MRIKSHEKDPSISSIQLYVCEKYGKSCSKRIFIFIRLSQCRMWAVALDVHQSFAKILALLQVAIRSGEQ